MFRPAVHKSGQIHTIDIETCPNLEEYIIIPMANEVIANNASQDINWNVINQEAPTRATALEQERQYEQKLINEAVEKNKTRKN